MRADRDRRSDIGDAAEDQRDVNQDVGRLVVPVAVLASAVVPGDGTSLRGGVSLTCGASRRCSAAVSGRHVDWSRIRGESSLRLRKSLLRHAFCSLR